MNGYAYIASKSPPPHRIVRERGGVFDNTIRDLERLRDDPVVYSRLLYPRDVSDGMLTGLFYQKRRPVRLFYPGMPNVLYFPDPYHPMEILAGFRGAFGSIPDGPEEPINTELAGKLGAVRGASMKAFCSALAKPLFWSIPQAVFLFWLFTPYAVNGGGPDEKLVRSLRAELYRASGQRYRGVALPEPSTGLDGAVFTPLWGAEGMLPQEIRI